MANNLASRVKALETENDPGRCVICEVTRLNQTVLGLTEEKSVCRHPRVTWREVLIGISPLEPQHANP
jgi:hypothetical protein